MVTPEIKPSRHPLAQDIYRLEAGGALLQDSPDNLIEVVGILTSYGYVLDAYWKNLIYISRDQFLVFFNFFKYFDGELSLQRLLKHWWHDRINYEYAEYTMKAMFWHGGGGLDAYMDTSEFAAYAEAAIQAKYANNPFMLALHRVFKGFLPEQIRQMCFYSGLGQFWNVMSKIFLELEARYNAGEIKSIPEVVQHVQDGIVADAGKPVYYEVPIGGREYTIVPKEAGLTFLPDTGIPYVEAIFFRGTPFHGTISYNAQAAQIPYEQGEFKYGALYADPLPIGGSGIPPTLLMQDMRHYLPDYLREFYATRGRGEDDLLVKICESFQKSMHCVTTAAIRGLAPHPLPATEPEQCEANRAYLENWMDRFINARLEAVNAGVAT
ncbi:MAG: CO2 hydration protein [Cyanobacteria bacterium J06641_5]